MTDKKEAKPFDPLKANLGTRRVPKLRMANFPNADDIVQEGLLEEDSRTDKMVDIMLVNPPTCLLYTSPSPRDQRGSRMPSSA